MTQRVNVRAVSCDTFAASATARSDTPDSRAARIAAIISARAEAALTAALRTLRSSWDSAAVGNGGNCSLHRGVGADALTQVVASKIGDFPGDLARFNWPLIGGIAFGLVFWAAVGWGLWQVLA